MKKSEILIWMIVAWVIFSIAIIFSPFGFFSALAAWMILTLGGVAIYGVIEHQDEIDRKK